MHFRNAQKGQTSCRKFVRLMIRRSRTIIGKRCLLNTPSHAAASLLFWRGEKGWLPMSVIVFGALLPDLPMFGFYAYQKLLAQRTEQEIWSTLYFQPEWQLLFDTVNSIPIAILLILVFRVFGLRWGVLLCGSALIHMLCDLPVHHDDAHRHFLPFSNWRFESPVSYWDRNHHGAWFASCELLFTVTATCAVAWKSSSTPMRIAAAATLVMFAIGSGFALIFLGH